MTAVVETLELKTEKMIGRKEGGIGWMIFNQPERRNAMSVAMTEAIPTILDNFRDDPAVRVIVLAGAGDKAFVSGADISEFEQRRSSPEAVAEFDRIGAEAARAYKTVGKPVIAMIQGFCMGGGLMTAMNADIRVASDDSEFGVPAARLGLGYGFGGVKGLSDLVGPAHAAEILFTGGRFPAEDAFRWGLINRVTSSEELEPTVRKMAEAIADNAPLTVKLVRTAVHEFVRDKSDRDYESMNQMVKDCFASDDYQEGRRAFMEKRRPEFKGR